MKALYASPNVTRCQVPTRSLVQLSTFLASSSVLASTGLLGLRPPSVALLAVVLAEFASFWLFVWAQGRQQGRAQRSALKLIRAMGGVPVSVVVCSNGQLEIYPSSSVATSDIKPRAELDPPEHVRPDAMACSQPLRPRPVVKSR